MTHIKSTIRLGSRGQAVEQLQGFLQLTVDGHFGPVTHQRLREYQELRYLKQDGIAGPVTRRVIRVDSWRDTVQRVCDELLIPRIRCDLRSEDLEDTGEYLVSCCLSLIEIESGGDAWARRPNSQYVGLLQIGSAAAADVLPASQQEDYARLLLGDGEASIRAWARYVLRYAEIHDWHPPHIAVLWKGGPGTLRRWREDLAEHSLEEMRQLPYWLRGWRPSVFAYYDRWHALEVPPRYVDDLPWRCR